MAQPPDMVPAMLLRECQQEVTQLRTELYGTRRVAEQRRVELESANRTKDGLEALVRTLQGQTHQLDATSAELGRMQAQVQELDADLQLCRKQLAQAQEARKILEAELAEERRARGLAEEARLRVEADKSRFQHARDDLLAALKLAEQRAAEAEAEQVRAEEEAGQLRNELLATQRGGSSTSMSSLPGGLPSAAITELQQQLDAARANTQSLYSSLREAQTELAARSAAAAAAQAEAAQLREALAQSQQAPAQQQAGADAAPAVTSTELYKALQEARGELADRSNQLRAAQQGMTLLDEQLRAADAEVRRLRGELAAADAQQNGWMGPEPAGAIHKSSSQPSLSGVGGDSEPVPEQVRSMHARINALKGSRDRLLAEVDRQSAEIERLAAENRAMVDELAVAKQMSSCWEAQAQEGMDRLDRLKDLLEESAAWDAGPGSKRSADVAAELQGRLLAESSRCAALDVQVRALCAELLRGQEASRMLGRSLLPVLTGIESRLVQLKPAKANG